MQRKVEAKLKVLLIRFSSIGDVLQSLSLVDVIRLKFPQAEIDFLTQQQFVEFFKQHPHVSQCWSVPKGSGVKELWNLSQHLKSQNYTHVYDAHNNLRSRLICWFLRIRGGRFIFLRRSIQRFKRWMLFRFRIHLFPKPFSGQMDMIRPLKAWGIEGEVPEQPSLFLADNVKEEMRLRLNEFTKNGYVALAPSAAYPLKRWPLEYWSRLIELCPDKKFVVLGGKEDVFLKSLSERFPDQVLNLAGSLSLIESAAVVSLSDLLISNDTGIMHMGEQTSKATIALMGPAPFGFPSKKTTKILERELWCRPCSKHGQGPCVNKEHQKCLRDISPEEVRREMLEQ